MDGKEGTLKALYERGNSIFSLIKIMVFFYAFSIIMVDA